MRQVEWLPPGEADHLDDACYLLDAIRALPGVEVRELVARRSWLAIKSHDDDLHIEFAVLSFASSDSAHRNERVKVVFNGSGPSGELRECRHTYWGEEDGYVFYPHGPTIVAAFRELAEFFDDMVAK